MSFAPQLARLLDADYSVLAKSGEGVVHNWGTGWPDRGLHTEERYPWTFYGANKTAGNTIWQSKRLPASAIISRSARTTSATRSAAPTMRSTCRHGRASCAVFMR